MKRVLIVMFVLVMLCCSAGFWTLYIRRNHQLDCINNMRQLYGAAVSYCLEQRLSPEVVLSRETLALYVKSDKNGTAPTCPSGRFPYPSFSVLNGPLCLNGHELEPGLQRPIRAEASNGKLAGLYRASGFTNLIESAEVSGRRKP